MTTARYDLLREQLSQHPLYSAINNKKNLKIFMEHHVYAVWDFMSLIKSLQAHIAPANLPWVPPKNSRHANFINQLVLEEESDYALTDRNGATHASHFESYCQAMREVEADTRPIAQLIDTVSKQGLEKALQLSDIPAPAKRFMAFTFDIIGRNQPHLTATVLAYGRESLVPQLFRSLQQGLQIDLPDASILCNYLERHIQLDEQEHGPLAVLMAQELCEGSDEKQDEKQAEAIVVAEQSLVARLDFWDGIHEALSV